MAEKPKTGIEQAVDLAGSQSELARRLGISPQAVQQWVTQGYAPVDRLVELEATTGIKRDKLCAPALSDLFSDRLPHDED